MNPLAIALQGVGFTPALVAVQGFGLIGTPTSEVNYLIYARRMGRR